MDASVRLDASDGSASDAGVGADAGPSTENSCRGRSGSDAVVAERFFDPQSPVSVAVHARGALLSWTQFRAGKSRVFSRWFGVEADAVDAPVAEDESNQLGVHSAATATGFLTTWSDEAGARVELRARRSDGDGVPLDSTPVAGAGANPSAAVSAQGADGKLLLAFRDGSQGRTLLLGADAKPVAAAHDVPGFGASLGRPTLAAFGAGYLLAWVDAATRRVHLQSLDATGVAATASLPIDSDGDAQGNLDLATTAAGGALA
ncbi:MAG TPA: hypothetical protein VFX59_11765, partial [Polyangiales bacterium]|nr:hypothetical protein [Polyangiales bacterium]